MELEEAIEGLETDIYNLTNFLTDSEKEIWQKAIDTIINYIKEESISIAVVEEQIGKINELLPDIDYHDIKDKQEREYYKKEFMKYITVRNYLQGLLNKGE